MQILQKDREYRIIDIVSKVIQIKRSVIVIIFGDQVSLKHLNMSARNHFIEDKLAQCIFQQFKIKNKYNKAMIKNVCRNF